MYKLIFIASVDTNNININYNNGFMRYLYYTFQDVWEYWLKTLDNIIDDENDNILQEIELFPVTIKNLKDEDDNKVKINVEEEEMDCSDEEIIIPIEEEEMDCSDEKNIIPFENSNMKDNNCSENIVDEIKENKNSKIENLVEKSNIIENTDILTIDYKKDPRCNPELYNDKTAIMPIKYEV